MMQTLFLNLRLSTLHFALFFGVFIIAGVLLTVLAYWTNRFLRELPISFIRTYFFEMVGVPVHEFSHVFFCKLFAHEIKGVKWFIANDKNGTQGSVTHSYHPWNPYQRLGHFFIGLGPAILGPFFIGFLMMILIPETRTVFFNVISLHSTLWSSFRPLLHVLTERTTLATYGFWIFGYLAACIVSQIELSKADLTQAAQGILPVFILVFIADLANAHFHFVSNLVIESAGRAFFSWIFSIATLAIIISLLNTTVLFFLTAMFSELGNPEAKNKLNRNKL